MVKAIFLFIVLLIVGGGFLTLTNRTLIKEKLTELQNSFLGFNDSNDSNDVIVLPPANLSGVEYLVDDAKGVVIAKFSSDQDISVDYDNNVEDTFEDFSKNEGYKLAVNGSYFRENYLHAGLLRINETIHNFLVANDRQLTHVVMLGEGLEIISNEEYLKLPEDGLSSKIDFQTGPLVILENEIQNDLIEDSLNGNIMSLRTIMGYTDNGEYFFAVFKRPISLKDAAQYLLDSEILANKSITAINLDGGSSVALYSEDNTNLNFGSLKKLPLVIGIK